MGRSLRTDTIQIDSLPHCSLKPRTCPLHPLLGKLPPNILDEEIHLQRAERGNATKNDRREISLPIRLNSTHLLALCIARCAQDFLTVESGEHQSSKHAERFHRIPCNGRFNLWARLKGHMGSNMMGDTSKDYMHP